MHTDSTRARALNNKPHGTGPVVYWMSRDQRVQDNWALLYAQDLAMQQKVPLLIVFCLRPDLREHRGTARLVDFMLPGLEAVAAEAGTLRLPFFLLLADPVGELKAFVRRHTVGTVVTDFSPLRRARAWRSTLAKELPVPLIEVDAHNIVPCWLASPKEEYSARTFRPKITRLLPQYLTPYPKVQRHPYSWSGHCPTINWSTLRRTVQVNEAICLPSELKPGPKEASRKLRVFLKSKLRNYKEHRNDPTKSGQSLLSPYLHFGQLAAARVALEAMKQPQLEAETFLEELIVRRELAENFCFYNEQYDTVKGFPVWAQKTLAEHSRDKRPYLYSEAKLDKAQTHDELWNAAQLELVHCGTMPGYLRMYWAKKILEWSPSATVAMQVAITLNDRYQIDGRDPNGYAGIAWSIGGVHDRPWFSRPIFGSVRYMARSGCERKFSVSAYVAAIHRHLLSDSK